MEERAQSGAADARPVDEIERILLAGLEKFEDACLEHVPFGRGAQSINYIPERCFVTYFSWELINKGFAVFNEQTVVCPEEQPQYTQRFDLVAMRPSPLAHKSIRLKVEAKGNLEAGYEGILADINRMEKCCVAPGILRAGQTAQDGDAKFAHQFNVVITQNWGLKELTEWWRDGRLDAPRRRVGNGFRSAQGWKDLKAKLRPARRGVVSVLEPGYGYSIDVLYAILAHPSLDQARGKNESGVR